ncbi:MAG: hypothetical protein Q9213_001412 [Squamulea squamosa]
MTDRTPAYDYQLAHINEDKGPQTIAASSILIVVTTIAVVLRLVAQRIVKPSFTADDYCALGALIFALALCGDLIALAWAIASLVVFIYQCDPIYFFWDRTYKLVGLDPPSEGTCLPSYSHQAAPMTLSALSDFLILLLPGIALWPLQMPWSRKIGLFFLFSLGAFVCGASIVKIYFIFAVDNGSDSSWFNTEILLWTIVECCIGLVCACLPCLTPLSRLVTVGPVAAFSSKPRKRSLAAMAKEDRTKVLNTNSRPWHGARRLPSVEDSRTVLSHGAAAHGTELDEWLDRRDVMNDGTTRSEPERQWMEGTLPDTTFNGLDLEMQSEAGLQLPNSPVAVGRTKVTQSLASMQATRVMNA